MTNMSNVEFCLYKVSKLPTMQFVMRRHRAEKFTSGCCHQSIWWMICINPFPLGRKNAIDVFASRKSSMRLVGLVRMISKSTTAIKPFEIYRITIQKIIFLSECSKPAQDHTPSSFVTLKFQVVTLQSIFFCMQHERRVTNLHNPYNPYSLIFEFSNQFCISITTISSQI